MKIVIDFFVNGERQRLEVAPWTTLLEILRKELHLIGTKEGCGLGDCGSCIVLMDGEAVNSCLILAADVHNKQIITIEGLSSNGKLHPLQKNFIKEGAVQCGFCTPAMILSAKALLDKNPGACREEVRQALSGVLCRCGSYKKIIEAVLATAREMKETI